MSEKSPQTILTVPEREPAFRRHGVHREPLLARDRACGRGRDRRSSRCPVVCTLDAFCDFFFAILGFGPCRAGARAAVRPLEGLSEQDLVTVLDLLGTVNKPAHASR